MLAKLAQVQASQREVLYADDRQLPGMKTLWMPGLSQDACLGASALRFGGWGDFRLRKFGLAAPHSHGTK